MSPPARRLIVWIAAIAPVAVRWRPARYLVLEDMQVLLTGSSTAH